MQLRLYQSKSLKLSIVSVLLMLFAMPAHAAIVTVESLYVLDRANPDPNQFPRITTVATFDTDGLGGASKLPLSSIVFTFEVQSFIDRGRKVHEALNIPQVPDANGIYPQGTFLAIFDSNGDFDRLRSEGGTGGFAQDPALLSPGLGSFLPVWMFLEDDGLLFRVSLSGGPARFDLVRHTIVSSGIQEVPLPAAAWLFVSALIGLAGFGKRRKPAQPLGAVA